MNEKMKSLNALIGLSAIGLAAVGVVGAVAGVAALLSNDFAGGGLLLIAAALSFGLMAGAVLKS